MTTKIHEQLIQRQIHNWNRYRELLRLSAEPERVKKRPVIAISRELGGGARTLAAALAQRLDLEIHGISLIDHIARDKNLERRVVEQFDEQVRSQIDLWVEGVLNQRIFLRDEYHVSLVKVVRSLAALGGVVFIGRGAHLILADQAALRVLVVASVETRVANVMRYEHLDEKAARERVAAADASRSQFLRKLFRVEPNDPHHFDLVLNADRIEPQHMVEVAMAALEAKGVFRD